MPEVPQGRWAVLLSEGCPDRAAVAEALEPLIRHRDGRIVVMPVAEPPAFLAWLQDQFNTRALPEYVLICDTFEHIPLEYQFILNAFLATGRLWLDGPEAFEAYLPPYLGAATQASALSRALLTSPGGPAALVLHFDISMGNNAPMYNPVTQAPDLQRALHGRFLTHLLNGETVGRATGPFRWGAGAFYAQAIYVFGQTVGHTPYIGTSGRAKTIGNFVDSMNMYHVTATDMRNYVILGDPAVRLMSGAA